VGLLGRKEITRGIGIHRKQDVETITSLPGADIGPLGSQSSGRSTNESASALLSPRRCSSLLPASVSVHTSMTSMTSTPGWEGQGRRRKRQSRYGGFPSGSHRLPYQLEYSCTQACTIYLKVSIISNIGFSPFFRLLKAAHLTSHLLACSRKTASSVCAWALPQGLLDGGDSHNVQGLLSASGCVHATQGADLPT
jgi:hypothetical protein